MSPAELRAIVRKTLELIADSTRWTERYFAEDKSGKWVPVGSQEAVRFNLAGAFINSAAPASREAVRAFTELLCAAPAGLETFRWRHAHGLGRSQALELLHWALGRLDSLHSNGQGVPQELHSKAGRVSVSGAGVKAPR
jgi:hypothetical protein